MQWIKAVDRLPDNAGIYNCKQNGKPKVCWYGKSTKCLLIQNKYQMEWLDEGAEAETIENMHKTMAWLQRTIASLIKQLKNKP